MTRWREWVEGLGLHYISVTGNVARFTLIFCIPISVLRSAIWKRQTSDRSFILILSLIWRRFVCNQDKTVGKVQLFTVVCQTVAHTFSLHYSRIMYISYILCLWVILFVSFRYIHVWSFFVIFYFDIKICSTVFLCPIFCFTLTFSMEKPHNGVKMSF